MIALYLAAFAVTAALLGLAEPAAAQTAPPAAQPGSGGIGLRLLDVPAEAHQDPRAQLYIVDHLAPGSVIERRIELSNTTSDRMRVVLYPAAAGIVNGAFLGSDGHTPNELSTWTTISPESVEVPPGGLEVATVTITVPADAAPGEQYAAVWAETRSDTTTGAGITQVSRVGVRLYLSVGPGGPPAADFNIDSVTATRSVDGRPTVKATVHNTGGRALDLSGALKLLNGPGALSAGPFPASLGTTLAIGATEPVTIVLDDQLPAGPWNARITLRSGLIERVEQMTITFPDVGASPQTALPQATASPMPVWQIIIAAGLGALIATIGSLLMRRRRRQRRPITPPGSRKVQIPVAWSSR